MAGIPPSAHRRLRWDWVWTVGAVLVGLACSFALWDPLDIDERAHVRRLTEHFTKSLRADLLADVHGYVLAQARVAELLAAEDARVGLSDADWRFRARLSLEHNHNELALFWIDRDLRVRWALAREATREATLRAAVGSRLGPQLNRLRGHPSADAQITPAFRLADGAAVVACVVPITRDSRPAGYLVTISDIHAFIHALLVDHRDLGYAMAVREGRQELYLSADAARRSQEGWSSTSDLSLAGVTWQVEVWPTREMLDEMRSPLPELALVVGGLLGFMLMVTVYFGRTARLRSEALRTAHDQLEDRVRDRTRELQGLSGRLLQLQDEERRRIARELHDSTAQVLGAAAMSLDTAQHLATAHSDKKLAATLATAREHVEATTQEIRTMSYLLHPPMLDDLGLEYVLPWYVEGFSQRSGIAVDLQVSPGFGRLPLDVELALFRIAQEGLANVHRHSGSQTASIDLSRTGDTVTLRIRDDGHGLPPGTQIGRDGRLGVGVAGMRERIRQLGGTLHILSNGGTTVDVALDLSAHPARAESQVPPPDGA